MRGGEGFRERGKGESTTQENSLVSNSSDIDHKLDCVTEESSFDQRKVSDEDSSKTESPTPALLDILEANGVPDRPHLQGGSDVRGESNSKPSKSQSRRMKKSKSTTNIKRCHDNKHLKPPMDKVYSSDEPLNYKFKAIGGSVQSDCSVVTRPPSPRLPFGLRSPWFRSSNKEESVAHGQGIRATQSGKISK